MARAISSGLERSTEPRARTLVRGIIEVYVEIEGDLFFAGRRDFSISKVWGVEVGVEMREAGWGDNEVPPIMAS